MVYNTSGSLERVGKPYGMYGALVGVGICGLVLIALYAAKIQDLEAFQACVSRYDTTVCMHELAY